MAAFVLLAAVLVSCATAAGITQSGVGCGTWYIEQADCNPVSASEYWDFNFTVVQGGTGSAPVTSNYEIAATTSGNNDRWGLYFSATAPTTCIDGSTSTAVACGTFSGLTPCNMLMCDPSLVPLCTGVQLTSTPGTVHTVRFGIRKNNNGAGPCAVTLAVFLPSGTTSASCNTPLIVDRTCPLTLTSGFAGPRTYAAAAGLAPLSLLALLLIAMAL